MVVSGPWFAGEIDRDVPYSRGRPLPTVERDRAADAPVPGRGGGVRLRALRSSPRRRRRSRASSRWASASVVRAKVGRQVPRSSAAYERAEVEGADPILAAFRAAAERATPMPNTLEMARVWEPMKLALRGVLQGGVEPAQTRARSADRRYRALHREAPARRHARSPGSSASGARRWWAFGGWQLRAAWTRQPFRKRYPDAGARRWPTSRRRRPGCCVLVVIPFVVGSRSRSSTTRPASTPSWASPTSSTSSPRAATASPSRSRFYFTLVVTVLWTVVERGAAREHRPRSSRSCSRTRCSSCAASTGCCSSSPGRCRTTSPRSCGRACSTGSSAPSTRSWWRSGSSRSAGSRAGPPSFAANVATNTWLGFPFMMVVSLGALQSIPQDLYEAAEVDGAIEWTQFRHITLPLLQPALLPAVILGTRVDLQHVQHHLPRLGRRAGRRHRHPGHRGLPLGLPAQRAVRLRGGVLGADLLRALRLVAGSPSASRATPRRPRETKRRLGWQMALLHAGLIAALRGDALPGALGGEDGAVAHADAGAVAPTPSPRR